MANTKISDFASGAPAQAADEFVIARSGANYKLAASDIQTLVNTPAGSDTQIQFNDGGAFAGDSGLTFNKTTNALTIGAGTLNMTGSSSGTITIQPAATAGTYTLTLPTNDGNSGQALTTDGNGVLSWSSVSATPGGSDTQVQFNDGGAFGGDAGLTFSKTSKALTLGGATITTDAPVLNATQTWNAGGVTFTGMRFNVTDTASASGSLLMDLRLGGASIVSVGKASLIAPLGSVNAGGSPGLAFQGLSKHGIGAQTNNLAFWVNDIIGLNLSDRTFGPGELRIPSNYHFSFSSATNNNSVADTILTRRAAANLRLGAADAAAPVAQTLSVQSVVAGTTNTAGANLTITGSQGTGTGAGGSIIFQVAPAGSSGTAQNALSTALQINGDRTISLPQYVSLDTRLGGATTETALSFYTANNSASVRNVRLINRDNKFRFDLLNDAGTAVLTTGIVSIDNNSAANSIVVTSTGVSTAALTLNGDLTISTKNIVTDGTTGSKIGTATSQKIGFWNATPIVQPTTAVAAATVAATGTGDVVAASTTFDGYTIPQIVKALRNAGLLA